MVLESIPLKICTFSSKVCNSQTREVKGPKGLRAPRPSRPDGVETDSRVHSGGVSTKAAVTTK